MTPTGEMWSYLLIQCTKEVKHPSDTVLIALAILHTTPHWPPVSLSQLTSPITLSSFVIHRLLHTLTLHSSAMLPPPVTPTSTSDQSQHTFRSTNRSRSERGRGGVQACVWRYFLLHVIGWTSEMCKYKNRPGRTEHCDV